MIKKIQKWLKRHETYRHQIIDQFRDKGQIEHHGSHLTWTYGGQTYQLLFYKIPFSQELTINSKLIWEIHYAGGSRLINQTHFLSSKQPKIVIIYPSAIKIKRYINENEMVFVEPNDFFHNMHVIRGIDVQPFLESK